MYSMSTLAVEHEYSMLKLNDADLLPQMHMSAEYSREKFKQHEQCITIRLVKFLRRSEAKSLIEWSQYLLRLKIQAEKKSHV